MAATRSRAVQTSGIADEPPEPSGDPRLAAAKLLQKAKRRKFVDIDIEGELLRFYYRDMGWMGKSACISEATEMLPTVNPKTNQVSIETKIHFDRYFGACLRRMLVDPPIPMDSPNIIGALGDEAGNAFESIIPDFFSTAQQVEETKKKSLTASDGDSSSELT